MKIRIHFNVWGNFVAYQGRRKIADRADLWNLIDNLRGMFGTDLTFSGEYAGEAEELNRKLERIEKES